MRDHVWQFRPHRDGAKGHPDAATWTQTVTERATPEWVQSLSRRLITAAIAIPVVLAIVWFGGWVLSLIHI